MGNNCVWKRKTGIFPETVTDDIWLYPLWTDTHFFYRLDFVPGLQQKENLAGVTT